MLKAHTEQEKEETAALSKVKVASVGDKPPHLPPLLLLFDGLPAEEGAAAGRCCRTIYKPRKVERGGGRRRRGERGGGRGKGGVGVLRMGKEGEDGGRRGRERREFEGGALNLGVGVAPCLGVKVPGMSCQSGGRGEATSSSLGASNPSMETRVFEPSNLKEGLVVTTLRRTIEMLVNHLV